jgi:4-hydroxy-tetrahydrodipicolinate synthase
VLAHFLAIADATELPVMIYDIPKRAGIEVATETLIELARHPRIVAVKDAKQDLAASSRVIAETELAFYAGDDAITLPMLAIGGVGVVGTSTHFSGAVTKRLIEAYLRGDLAEALALHQQLLPIFTGVFRAQGVTMVKAGLQLQGRSVGSVRLPQVPATEQEINSLRADLAASGLL